MKTLVFFDLDGTILDGISSENAFFLHLLRKGVIGFRQFFAAFIYIFRWFPTFKFYVFIKDKAYLSGLSVDAIEALGVQYVAKHLMPKIRPRIQAIIEKHRKMGDYVVLLTGSPYFLAKNLAKQLGIPEVQPTYCVQKDGKFTSDPPLQHPFAQEKVTIAQRLCTQYQVDIKTCSAYGNSMNDRFLLEQVGHPVAVTPSRRLRRLASHRGWQIIN